MQKILDIAQYIMKKLLFSIVVMTIIMMTSGCQISKEVTYFQNIDSISLAASKMLYDAKIMPKDMLTITVATINPEASAPFNLVVRNQLSSSGSLSSGQGSLQGYLVDNDGNIEFPVLGTLHVVGLTKTECQNLIKQKVAPYLAKGENPVVTVRLSSYRVTVIGEVGRSAVIPVSTEKMSILECLAQAGDLGIYGRRSNILLIREDATGEKHAVRLNLNDANLLNSPYYYLQQNDVIYVEPNKVKARNADIGSSVTIWFSFVSILTSISTLLVSILKN